MELTFYICKKNTKVFLILPSKILHQSFCFHYKSLKICNLNQFSIDLNVTFGLEVKITVNLNLERLEGFFSVVWILKEIN